MSFLGNVLAFFIYTISLSYALRCISSCRFTSDLNSTFEIPNSCNQVTPAENCAFRMSYWYYGFYSYLSFELDHSNYSSGGYSSSNIRLTNDGSFSFDYSVSYQCNHKDDCAFEFANNKIPDLLRRLTFNYTDIKEELSPLLSANSLTEHVDLPCFDANENVRQCAIAGKPGTCQVTQQLWGRRKQNRTCIHGSFPSDKSINIFDLGTFGTFDITCNRPLCNGRMTLQAVKEIMFKYNITKTIDGQLNNGIPRSLSLTFLISIIILLFSV